MILLAERFSSCALDPLQSATDPFNILVQVIHMKNTEISFLR
jgi:hypothetical protein